MPLVATGFGTTGVVITNKSGRLYQIQFVNKAATAYFVQIHDKAFAPISTDVPIWESQMAVSSEKFLKFIRRHLLRE